MIWGVIWLLVFFASSARGGGAGAWAIGVPALLCLATFVLSIFRGEKEITRLDTASLIVAFFSIALWAVTTNPLWSVIIVTGIDVVGFVPTFRKANKRPDEESITVFAFTGVSFFISLFALQSVNITTVLYPASVIASNTVFISMVMLRRRSISANSTRGKPKSHR